jgi:hypothetical protein
MIADLHADTGISFATRMTPAQRASEAEQLTIRAAFNRWCGPVQRMDSEGKKQEVADREATITALLDLRAIAHAGTVSGSVRAVQASDVDRVLSCFRRLTLLGKVTPAEIAKYCEKMAADDDNEIAHRADPLSLRYVLTYHQESTRAWFAENGIERLRYVCERADLAGIRSWFETVTANTEKLPKDSCQYLRHVLLQFWNRRMGDLETLAFEQAVLEVRLSSTVGWENTRMFYTLLRKIGGGSRSAFGAYLNSDDIKEALALHETLGQADQCAHFRALAAVHEPKLVDQLEQMVFANAAHADAVAATTAVVESTPVADSSVPATQPVAKQSRLRRLFGARSAAA